MSQSKEEYLAHIRERYRQRIADGRCTQCNQPNANGHTLCDACRAYHKQSVARMLEYRRAHHRCEKCNAPTIDNHTRCEKCLARHRLKMKKLRWGVA